MGVLEPSAIESFLAEHEDWSQVDGALQRVFTFDDHFAAHSLANRLAFHAEEEDHHPDLHISYRKLTVRLRTHDADGITDNDTGFVEWVDSFFRIREAASLFKNPKSARELNRVLQETIDRFEAAFDKLTPEQLQGTVGKGKRTVLEQAVVRPITQATQHMGWIRNHLGLPEPEAKVDTTALARAEDAGLLKAALGLLRKDIEGTCGHLHDGVMSDRGYLTELGTVSDVEQMLEKTVVEIDRHRTMVDDAAAG